ncbi:basic proline-rich protein-like [Dama dama]|uniref:basic proline-rich protein-like n=1 Tax=Dama dama TaxID=30532 RepID=UPI002A36FE9F|nr:basic proline-rich protein-like [Dama dama]
MNLKQQNKRKNTSGEDRRASTPTPPPPSVPDTASLSPTAQTASNQGAKQRCEIHTRKPYTRNRPRHPRKNRPGEETPGGPLSSEDNTPRREVAGHRRSCPETSPQPPHFLGNAMPSAAGRGQATGLGAGSRVGAAEGGAPRKAGRPEEPAASPAPPRGPDRRSLPAQPRAGAAVRRRRRRRDPGPRRRVIIPPARAGPGPGPRPPEPSPRPSRGGSPLSLPPAPPPGPSPPPPPPLTRALPPRPPAAVRGHRRAPSSAAAVVARPDKLSAERPPSSGPPRLTGTSPGSRAMTPTEAEVRESRRITTTSYYGTF